MPVLSDRSRTSRTGLTRVILVIPGSDSIFADWNRAVTGLITEGIRVSKFSFIAAAIMMVLKVLPGS